MLSTRFVSTEKKKPGATRLRQVLTPKEGGNVQMTELSWGERRVFSRILLDPNGYVKGKLHLKENCQILGAEFSRDPWLCPHLRTWPFSCRG